MAAKIHYLHGRPSPISQIIRIGYSGYRQLETLFNTGRFSPKCVVVDAAQFNAQRDLINSLWDSGTEIILDTNVAELSSIGRYSGAGKTLKWANSERPLNPSDFSGARRRKILGEIAEFAVARNVDTILLPTHLTKSARGDWTAIDVQTCELMRRVLDDSGGEHIALDYPLIIPYSTLRDPIERRTLTKELGGLPYENLWLRVSGFGADATPVGVRRYIANLADFHEVEKPIVADCVGGIASLAVLAFGAVSGVAHGVAEKERFDASGWDQPRKNGGGGQSGRLYLPGIDRHLKVSEAKKLFQARGARRLVACTDRDCCPRGLTDMENNPKAHFLTQRRKQLEDLERAPDDRRVTRFLDHHLAVADRTARQVARLNVEDEAIKGALGRASTRLDRMRGVLEALEDTLGADASRSKPVVERETVSARKNMRGTS